MVWFLECIVIDLGQEGDVEAVAVPLPPLLPPRRRHRRQTWLGWHYLSNITCLIRPRVFYACVFRRVKDHHNLPHDSPRLKSTCVIQVVFDKWFPIE